MATVLLFATDALLQGEPEHLEWLARPDVDFVGHAESADPLIRLCTVAVTRARPGGGQRQSTALAAVGGDTLSTAACVGCKGEVYRVPVQLKDELLDATAHALIGNEAFEACERDIPLRFEDMGGEALGKWVGCSPRTGRTLASGGAVLLPAPFDVRNLMAVDPEAAMSWRRRPGHREPTPQVVFVMLDGAADTACPELRGQTPFQAAKREAPGLNLIADHGSIGLLDPVRPGLACGSETAHLSMMGFDPALYFAGRGAFEALGGGMDMSPGDVGFKCNFARFEERASAEDSDTTAAGRIVTHRKFDEGEAATYDAQVLSDAIDGIIVAVPLEDCEQVVHVRMRAKHAMNHRLGIVLSLASSSQQASGALGLTAAITDTDPIVDRKPLLACRPASLSSPDEASVATTAAQRVTAAAVNLLSDEITRRLRDHPINQRRRKDGQPTADIVLFRGAAGLAHQPTLGQRFGFRRPCALAPTCVIAGLFRTLGVEPLPVPEGATGTEHSNLAAKAEAVIRAMQWGGGAQDDNDDDNEGGAAQQRRDFCFLHVKGTDEAGHGKDPLLKVAVLKRVGAMLEQLWAAAPTGTVFAMASDHSTPCAVGDHTSDPVACCIGIKHEPAVQPTAPGPGFDEMSCGSNRAGLGRIAGCDLMRRLVLAAGAVARERPARTAE